MDKIIYNTFRGAYSISDIRQTMTVGEIIELLSQYDEETPVYLSFDNGYTYGGIDADSFEEHFGEEDAE